MKQKRTQPPEDPGVVVWDGGLRLRGTSLWLDARRPVPLSFLSSALSFRHQLRIVTRPETTWLLEGRLGSSDALASPLDRQFSVGDIVLEMLPAGTVVGSAMLHVRHGGLDILYCGGLRAKGGWLGEPAIVRRVDVLVLDCPYDDAQSKFPGRRATGQALVEWTREALDADDTPVLAAAELGMAQELVLLLAKEGFPLRVHRGIGAWNRKVRNCGVPLAPAPELREPVRPGEVVLWPPRLISSSTLERLAPRRRTALVSGLADRKDVLERVGADTGFALSCHSDARALRRFVRDTDTSHVYLGPRHSPAFATTLRRLGVTVTHFAAPSSEQLALF